MFGREPVGVMERAGGDTVHSHQRDDAWVAVDGSPRNFHARHCLPAQLTAPGRRRGVVHSLFRSVDRQRGSEGYARRLSPSSRESRNRNDED